MNLVKTPVQNGVPPITTFRVNREDLRLSAVALTRFLGANQDPNDRFPTFPFQLEDADYSSLLTWPEELYAAFRQTRLPITLDAIRGWLQFHDIETAEGTNYTLEIVDEPSRAGQPVDSEFLAAVEAFGNDPANFTSSPDDPKLTLNEFKAELEDQGDPSFAEICEAAKRIDEMRLGGKASAVEIEQGKKRFLSMFHGQVSIIDNPGQPLVFKLNLHPSDPEPTPFDAIFADKASEQQN